MERVEDCSWDILLKGLEVTYIISVCTALFRKDHMIPPMFYIVRKYSFELIIDKRERTWVLLSSSPFAISQEL